MRYVFLDYPVIWNLYPHFHQNRSRFFNMATFYLHALNGINVGLKNAFSKEDLKDLLPLEEMTYRSYIEWEDNGGIDLQLPSFKLVNRQMIWVCMVHSLAQKYHKKTPKRNGEYIRIINDNLNTYLKRNLGFREAFQCGNLTKTEESQVEELRKKLNDFLKFN